MAHKKQARHTAKKTVAKTKPSWLVPVLVVGIAVVALGVFALLQRGGTTNASLPREVSVAQAFEKREAGAFILDVRQPEEWQEFHVPNSTLIPLGELESRVSELPEDQEIVVVCRSGNRSQSGRDILLEAGFERVTSLAGGLTQWRAAGYPTESGD